MTNANVMEKPQTIELFEELESQVRSYIRSFPTVFTKAKGYRLWDEAGKEYIDFFAGAGSLNYGHNHPVLKQKVIDYMMEDGVVHSLDMATKAKAEFLKRFEQIILKPRGMDHKIMFPGPTGTNSVEAALKIARKVTGRDTIMCFTNAFHGMTMGSLSITGNAMKREGAGVALHNSVFMPYDGYFGEEVDTVDYIDAMLQDNGSGVDKPAAIIFETVQGEGGINVSSYEWMKRIEQLCRRHDILLIVDDVQMGCGRTGTFFSFEKAGIEPDIICMSKSIGGFGLPFAITLLRPELDIWKPGEHNGTFRGNNLSFVAAAEALSFWADTKLTEKIDRQAEQIQETLESVAKAYPKLKGSARGRGFIQGIAFEAGSAADEISAEAFKRGLIMETSGVESQVLKVMPPLTIDDKGLNEGLELLRQSVKAVHDRLDG
ncbi:diaminobutyrate--2-oxoglutarate transaminase [Xylanibacillus composti]|uniref:Diaminobutyrate--2-oxoglutarate transaminase n=1 Tax=Xylanibacillus composti TaxID=1572762 RepID=A0A8J4M2X1_9BACL|nr:diaminobutyrate--2-oxoglutarate transaminase [Xylanibacillus composti]MDT9726558.1 diaminobutyrate--2-oxoglutarate transaminase [Xylanibacillus composti]GIQ68976.1 diaminobutyrate--2-oxoglutarate transaminase [Xylanibacillus composti]